MLEPARDMAGSAEAFQRSLEAAEAYESKFVPALFGEWAPHLVDAAGVAPGHSVLDVACGTGMVTREVANRLGGDGKVVGVDVNEAMLTVAAQLALSSCVQRCCPGARLGRRSDFSSRCTERSVLRQPGGAKSSRAMPSGSLKLRPEP